MNQKVVIYIILSAILLYLYYRKGDLAIFAAFVVVVTGTLILGKGGSVEGFGIGGGGGGGDKECAKLGFKEVKIDKKNINGSLKKIFANFKTVTSKYLDYNDKSPQPKEEYIESLGALEKFEIIKSEMKKVNKDEKNQEYFNAIAFGSVRLLHPYLILKEEKERTKFMEMLQKFKEKSEKTGRTVFESILKGGELGSKVLEKIKKSDELKESDKEVKKVFSVIHCSFKQVLSIWKALDKVVVEGDGGDEGGDGEGDGDGEKGGDDGDGDGGDGDDDDDDEGKKKKKKKKATKKKKKDADDDAADDAADDE